MWLRVLIFLGVVAFLFSLLSMAIFRAIKSGPAPILSEIDQLHSSIQAYKEKHGVYPPCLADADPDTRKRRLMEHLAKVYPSSTYGAAPADFDQLNQSISADYRVSTGGDAVSLDLNRLDAAEALVFWLGGFPTPVSTAPGSNNLPVAASRLFGFNKDSDAPLKRSLKAERNDPLATRTDPRFHFRQERLVDQDGDGWWEYASLPPFSSEIVAPFVYFDAATYRGSSAKPELLGSVLYPVDAKLAAAFGTAVPLAETYDPANESAMRWANPDSFQLICGAYDGKFSAPETGARISVFPAGRTFPGPNFDGKPGGYDEAELDNLTNLSYLSLRDARDKAN